MKNKTRKTNAERSTDTPEWYWIYGLHDAEILSFSELQLSPDWKSERPVYNCLEIALDTAGAMTKLKRITLYNYNLKTEFDINALKKPWWMGDTLTVLPNNRFLLDVEIEDAKGSKYAFSVTFEDANVE